MKSTESKPTRVRDSGQEEMRLRIRLKDRQVDGLIRKGYLRREDRDDIQHHPQFRRGTRDPRWTAFPARFPIGPGGQRR